MGGFESPGAPAGPGAPLPQIVIQGGSPAADPAAVATAVSAGYGYTTSVLNWITGFVKTLFGSLFTQLGALFNALWQWLKALRETWLGQILASVWSRVRAIFSELAKWAKKVNATLTALKKLQDEYFTRYFKPLLDLMQRARRILLIFRALHIKWAQKLDADLAGLELRLTKAFLDVRREINRLTDYINLILDPRGLLRPNILLGTAAQSIGEIVKLIQQYGFPKPTAAQQAAADTAAHQFDEKQAAALYHQINETGLPADWQAEDTTANKTFQDMGYLI